MTLLRRHMTSLWSPSPTNTRHEEVSDKVSGKVQSTPYEHFMTEEPLVQKPLFGTLSFCILRLKNPQNREKSSKKKTFPTTPERALWVKKSTSLYRAFTVKMRFFLARNTLFWGGGKRGFFWLWNPLFPILGILTPVLRGPASILFISQDTCSDSISNCFVLVVVGYHKSEKTL